MSNCLDRSRTLSLALHMLKTCRVSCLTAYKGNRKHLLVYIAAGTMPDTNVGYSVTQEWGAWLVYDAASRMTAQIR